MFGHIPSALIETLAPSTALRLFLSPVSRAFLIFVSASIAFSSPGLSSLAHANPEPAETKPAQPEPAQVDLARPEPAKDEADIRASFIALQAALTAKDADRTLALLSSETKDYYELLRQLAANSTPAELEALSPMNRIMVDTVKRFIPAAVLKDKTPSALLKTAIQRGLAAEDIKKDIKLTGIELRGDKALAGLDKLGSRLPLRLGFSREESGWKVNILSLIEQTNAMTEAMLAKTKISKEEWIKKTEARMLPPGSLQKQKKQPAQTRASSKRKASTTP